MPTETRGQPSVRLEPKELPFTRKALSGLLRERNCDVVESSESTSLVSWLYDSYGVQFLEGLGRIWTETDGSCKPRPFVLFSPLGELGSLWRSLSPILGPAVQEYAVPCTERGIDKVLEAVQRAELKVPAPWAMPIVKHAVEAGALQRDIVRFLGHNATADVSNHFLAPARLMLLAAEATGESSVDVQQGWNDVWNGTGGMGGVEKELLKADQKKFGNLGTQVARTAAEIGSLLKAPLAPSALSAIERLMALLTECRNACGQSTSGESGTASAKHGVLPVLSNPNPVREDVLRVLVVDDHAAAWRCVFEKAAAVVDRGLEHQVLFEFSLDGERSWDAAGASHPVRFGLYDLVILDIFLGGTDASGRPRDGRRILKERIRPDLIHTPVLLWTTSRDDEITTDASRANGVLLKKTIGWEEFCSVIAEWLRIGRAKGRTALPSPVFNHSINDENLRRLVIDANEWCLKQLDSFHALDGEYFRYFTDHGGRHIVTLFGLLEQALRPFLAGPRGAADPLLSDDRGVRETEMTALSLAVVCHELGMFPMVSGKSCEDFSTLGPTYLNDVRTLHAVRGMALLSAKDDRYWSDTAGAELGRRFHAIPIVKGKAQEVVSLGDLVAVLVGYHARLLKSLGAANFLKWEEPKRFSSLGASAPTLTRADTVFRDTLEDLNRRIAPHPELKARLRRQCAMFRFVDAIDITASRNPALFLIHSARRGKTQNREYLKRQLCTYLAIEGGVVAATVLAVKPSVEALTRALASLAVLPPNEPAQVLAEPADASVVESALSQPWSDDGTQRKFLRRIQPCLDHWLESAWEVLMGLRDTPEFLSSLRTMNVISPGNPIRVTEEGKKIVASLTALSVAAEVLDEYEAIEEGGLKERLRLGHFEWAEGWKSVPAGVTILGEALRIYSAGRAD